MNRLFVTIAATVSLATAANIGTAAETAAAKKGPRASASLNAIDRGKYMLIVGGCNDCHTADFAARMGDVPEREWLKGSGKLGFSGPWGTTYGSNLRLGLSTMSETQWVRYAKELKTRPPMPWFSLNQWTDTDLRAFYKYVRSLGSPGEPVPAYLPPDKAPPPPVIQWPAAAK
ncbi:MAG TPA: cytochrome C [Casimicrobiaceae bacterium]|jgi:mono/diheme cytochrome c family protein